MTWCRASELVGFSALYLLLHLMAYTLLFRRWAAFASERNVFLYHLGSAVFFSGVALSIGTTCADPSVLSASLGVIFMHGIYSLSFLEVWSLAQGSYSITILIRVMQRDSIAKIRLQEELTHIGQGKKHNRLSALSTLHLIHREGGMVSLTIGGRMISRGLKGLVWLTNPKDTG
jgi:hypothetical protein